MATHLSYSTCTSGQGAVTFNRVTLQTATPFVSNTFTLIGDTRGGPPTNYTWTRNGVDITRNSQVVGDGPSSFYIVLVSGSREQDRLNPRYLNTLRVTGNYPGLYEYSVFNRAMTSSRTDSFGIQGKHLLAKLKVLTHNVPITCRYPFIHACTLFIGGGSRGAMAPPRISDGLSWPPQNFEFCG